MLIAIIISVAFNIALAWLLYQAVVDLSDLNKQLRNLEYKLGRMDAYINPSRHV